MQIAYILHVACALHVRWCVTCMLHPWCVCGCMQYMHIVHTVVQAHTYVDACSPATCICSMYMQCYYCDVRCMVHAAYMLRGVAYCLYAMYCMFVAELDSELAARCVYNGSSESGEHAAILEALRREVLNDEGAMSLSVRPRPTTHTHTRKHACAYASTHARMPTRTCTCHPPARLPAFPAVCRRAGRPPAHPPACPPATRKQACRHAGLSAHPPTNHTCGFRRSVLPIITLENTWPVMPCYAYTCKEERGGGADLHNTHVGEQHHRSRMLAPFHRTQTHQSFMAWSHVDAWPATHNTAEDT